MKPIKFNYQVNVSAGKGLAILLAVLVLTNFVTFQLFKSSFSGPSMANNQQHNQGGWGKYAHQVNMKDEYRTKTGGLYLLDQAKMYVYNVNAFEQKVREVSRKLGVAPEWLMAVMHSESRFDASVKNRLGSGATGLIQFMPATAKDLEITVNKLRNMNHVEQLDFVYDYLNEKRKRYRNFDSLTDLYLAILYPKALSGEFCYTLYAKPSKAYQMNSGLDEDKDGRVTVADIDRRMKRVYPTAYVAQKDGSIKPMHQGGNVTTAGYMGN